MAGTEFPNLNLKKSELKCKNVLFQGLGREEMPFSLEVIVTYPTTDQMCPHTARQTK
jgi:hypothetical protein